MINKKNILIPALLLIFSCISPLPGERPEEKSGMLFKEVEITEVQLPVRATGTLSSKTQSNLSFMTGGIIRKIHVREGAEADKGAVLAELDLTEIESRVKQAEYAFKKAERDYTRVRSLHADSVATLENMQDAKTALDIARSDLRIAEFSLNYSIINAPANGKILKKLKEVNEITGPGHPVFVFASTEADWILKVSLSDRDIVRIKPGDSAVIAFDAYPGKEFRAGVSETAMASNLLSGTFDAVLTLTELPERLVTGLIGSAVIYPQKIKGFVIPYVSLKEASGQKAWIYVLQNGVPVRREISILALTDEGVFVDKGVDEKDTVVTEGAAYIRK